MRDEELKLARRFGAPRALGIALRTAGVVAGGDQRIARLREAESVLRCSGGRLEHARALIDLGAATRRAGSRVPARELLREGLERATACGSAAEASRAHAELLAAGARPRRLTFPGVDSLTAREAPGAALAPG